jgi:hypothetical protein
VNTVASAERFATSRAAAKAARAAE